MIKCCIETNGLSVESKVDSQIAALAMIELFKLYLEYKEYVEKDLGEIEEFIFYVYNDKTGLGFQMIQVNNEVDNETI